MSTTAWKTGSPWVVRPQANPAATLRVFCFPYAGLGASVYRTWPAALPRTIELVAMQPPGREGRWSEKAFQSLEALVPAAAEAMLPMLTVPFVFYGHSLGALASFEIARYLRRHGRPQPLHLFASAHRAPHLPNPHPEIRLLPDGEFIGRICEQYGGIPQAVLDSPELIELMLPCLRADFTAFETYLYTDEPPLACPITAFGGLGDRRVREHEVAAWRSQTTGEFRHQMFDGNHFFLQDRRDELLASMKRDLAAVGLVPAGV